MTEPDPAPITFAEARERVLAALDAHPDRHFADLEFCTYFAFADATTYMPTPDYTPSCALGRAFPDVFQSIAGLPSPSQYDNGHLCNGVGIRTLTSTLLLGRFTRETEDFLSEVQGMNDDGKPWKDIAAWVRAEYPAPASSSAPAAVRADAAAPSRVLVKVEK